MQFRPYSTARPLLSVTGPCDRVILVSTVPALRFSTSSVVSSMTRRTRTWLPVRTAFRWLSCSVRSRTTTSIGPISNEENTRPLPLADGENVTRATSLHRSRLVELSAVKRDFDFHVNVLSTQVTENVEHVLPLKRKCAAAPFP